MFSGCSSLTSLDVSGFDTSNVTNMSNIFTSCSSLAEIKLPYGIQEGVSAALEETWYDQATGEEVTVIDNAHCSKSAAETMTIAKTPPQPEPQYLASAWKTQIAQHYGISMDSVERISFVKGALTEEEQDMGCALAVTNADGTGTLGTAIVGLYNAEDHSLVIKSANTIYCPKSAYQMFYGLSSLTELELSELDTGNVTDMSSMFSGCSGLTSLDVSSFDTSEVTNMSYMFVGC